MTVGAVGAGNANPQDPEAFSDQMGHVNTSSESWVFPAVYPQLDSQCEGATVLFFWLSEHSQPAKETH